MLTFLKEDCGWYVTDLEHVVPRIQGHCVFDADNPHASSMLGLLRQTPTETSTPSSEETQHSFCAQSLYLVQYLSTERRKTSPNLWCTLFCRELSMHNIKTKLDMKTLVVLNNEAIFATRWISLMMMQWTSFLQLASRKVTCKSIFTTFYTQKRVDFLVNNSADDKYRY